MHLIPLKSDTGISIVPVVVEHAEALALLVQQNAEHLGQYLPALSRLSSVEVARTHLLTAVEQAAIGEIFEWHIVVYARGFPLAIMVTGANRHDLIAFESTLDAIPAVPGLDRRPRKRPGILHADNGYAYARCRRYLRKRCITARIACKGIERKDRLGRHHLVVERTHFWFAGVGKLRIRFERRLDIHKALLSIAPPVITSRFVDDFC